MCLSTATFALFLTIMGPDKIDSEPGRYIIHADGRDAHWVATPGKDRWCTIAPYVEHMERVAARRAG